jgi:NADPH-dependent 2,4-dienoyl-CoA reductase/sulfur reductase-like enzyme
MHEIDRRQLGAGLAALTLALGAGIRPLRAAAGAKVVVIGGGPGGATVATALKRTAPDLDVTLVEPQRRYTTCFYSNHFIGGFRSFNSITHDYSGLTALGITIAYDRAAAIDLTKREVRIERGRALPYDRLVVAPGIALKYGAIAGYTEAASYFMPHAWSGGRQSRLLRERLDDMKDGGLVVIAPPRNPYRCPPGPYERACLIANYLKREKPKSKLLILDPKMSFSKQAVFEEAFQKYYKGIIELHLSNDIDDMSVARVDAKTGEVVTKSGETFKAAVANIIPDQRAGDIAIAAGLADGDWCHVEVETFRSVKDPNVYVVGDATVAADMPKSAFSASNQARAVAGHILADLLGKERPAAQYRNTCWSMLAPDDSVKIGADYTPGDANGKHLLVARNPFVSKTGESADLRKETYLESVAWYETLVADMFAKSGSSGSKQAAGKG